MTRSRKPIGSAHFRRCGRLSAAAAMACVLALPTRVFAADGDLDVTFGTGGRVLTDFTSSSDMGYGLVIQSDGRIVVVGQTANDFGLLRFTTDGNLDASFGAGGKVATDFSGGFDSARGVAIQSDGKLVVAGYTTLDFALARYGTNGGLDATFGTGGKVTTDFFGSLDRAFAIAIQSDGKIVAAGFALDLAGHSNLAVARYNTDGSLDASFSGDGKVTFQLTSGTDAADAVAIQPDGKILVAGRAGTSWGVIRILPDGSALDPTFSGDGMVTLFTGDANSAGAGEVLVQSDGKIVAAGVTVDANKDFAVARFTSDGNLDLSGFNSPSGSITTDIAGGDDSGQSAAFEPDGKLVVAGVAANGAHSDFALARYGTDGTLDAGFHGSGKVTTDFAGLDDAANAVAVQSDGKIVAAGSAMTAAGSDFAIARYQAASGTLGVPSPNQPNTLSLAPASPNPARSDVALDFVLPEGGAVTLAIYDVAGQRVRVLLDGFVPAGAHSIQWDRRTTAGTFAAPGLYFGRLSAAGLTLSRRVAIVR